MNYQQAFLQAMVESKVTISLLAIRTEWNTRRIEYVLKEAETWHPNLDTLLQLCYSLPCDVFRFFALAEFGSDGNHQSPITNHQSPITNHQSPITNHQSPITNHQSPITRSKESRERIVVEYAQTTGGYFSAGAMGYRTSIASTPKRAGLVTKGDKRSSWVLYAGNKPA